MAETFHLQVACKDRTVFEGDATSIVVPGEEGYLGVLPNHAPLLSTLGHGALEIDAADGAQRYELTGGFLEVLDNEVTVLADTIELPAPAAAR